MYTLIGDALGNAQNKSVLLIYKFAPLLSSIISDLPPWAIKSGLGQDWKDVIAKKKAAQVGPWIKNLIYIGTIFTGDKLTGFSFCKLL